VPRQILVVDDRWENRAVVVNLLEPLGFKVIEADNGQDGLDKLQQDGSDWIRPDLVITDLSMPVMDGFEFLQQIRNHEQLKTLTVIVSSASVAESDRQMSLNAGGDDFLAKPLQANELFRLLAHHLHLTWVYEATDPDDLSSPATLEVIPPPPKDLQQLLEFAQKGRLKQVITLAEQIGQKDNCYQPFVQKVLQLTKQFRCEELEHWIEHCLSSNHNVGE
jgi:CheY-like chemotaxis protein